jgi:hypothetical protein
MRSSEAGFDSSVLSLNGSASLAAGSSFYGLSGRAAAAQR